MKLYDLIKGYENAEITGETKLEIKGIEYNSKEAGKDKLFVAIKGEKLDGHNYITDALTRGTRAFIVDKSFDITGLNGTAIKVNNTLDALAYISSRLYGEPSNEMMIAGITGTNGKTTITYLLESIWKGEKQIVGIIGTVNYRFNNYSEPSSLTTPMSRDLQGLLSHMRDSGVRKVFMEVSSHSLEKCRINYCKIDIGVFTNITQDHLDYHLDFNNYFNAKKKLFSEILNNSTKKQKFAVSNLDDPRGKEIVNEFTGDKIMYSVSDSRADVYAEHAKFSDNGIEALVNTPWGKLNIESTLIGTHNLSNILAAISCSICMGADIKSVENGIYKLKNIPGRLERIENNNGFSVFVDYAHTPDALKNVLDVLRSFTENRLIVVFGCGGDRDTSKRPLMGIHAADIADYVIVTSDNPRTESPVSIMLDIEKGIKSINGLKSEYVLIEDRKSAILTAVKMLRNGDVLLVAGKGHEDYQIIGTEKRHFDDREECREAIREVNSYTH